MEAHLSLDQLKIASPCGVSWDDMRAVEGGDRVRHCDHCRLNVYNLSEMSGDDAALLIRAHEGQRLCVRMYKRADGTVITADCPVGLSRARRRLIRLGAGVAALFGLAGVAVALERASEQRGVATASTLRPFSWIARHVYGRNPPPQQQWAVMGDICVTPPSNTTNPAPSTGSEAAPSAPLVH